MKSHHNYDHRQVAHHKYDDFERCCQTSIFAVVLLSHIVVSTQTVSRMLFHEFMGKLEMNELSERSRAHRPNPCRNKLMRETTFICSIRHYWNYECMIEEKERMFFRR